MRALCNTRRCKRKMATFVDSLASRRPTHAPQPQGEKRMRTSKTMIIGLHLGNGYGSQPGAWRMPWVDPTNYISFDARVRQAQAAERGNSSSSSCRMARVPLPISTTKRRTSIWT